jgi:hypothetical protein
LPSVARFAEARLDDIAVETFSFAGRIGSAESRGEPSDKRRAAHCGSITASFVISWKARVRLGELRLP